MAQLPRSRDGGGAGDEIWLANTPWRPGDEVRASGHHCQPGGAAGLYSRRPSPPAAPVSEAAFHSLRLLLRIPEHFIRSLTSISFGLCANICIELIDSVKFSGLMDIADLPVDNKTGKNITTVAMSEYIQHKNSETNIL